MDIIHARIQTLFRADDFFFFRILGTFFPPPLLGIQRMRFLLEPPPRVFSRSLYATFAAEDRQSDVSGWSRKSGRRLRR